MALLNVHHLRKGYGDTVVLQDLDLSLEKGEVVVILGPSGSGKSSLLRCINGLEPHQGGSIEMEGVGEFGKDVPWETARQKVGMVFQSYELFAHMNVIDNILLSPLKAQGRRREEVEAQADKLLASVGLLNRKTAFPRELSGGQKQRIAIARAAGAGTRGHEHAHRYPRNGIRRQSSRPDYLMGQGNIIEESTSAKFFTKPESSCTQQFLSGADYSPASMPTTRKTNSRGIPSRSDIRVVTTLTNRNKTIIRNRVFNCSIWAILMEEYNW